MTKVHIKAVTYSMGIENFPPVPRTFVKSPSLCVAREIKAQFPATLPFSKILSKAKTIKEIQGNERKYISIFFIGRSGGKVEGVGSEMSRADVHRAINWLPC